MMFLRRGLARSNVLKSTLLRSTNPAKMMTASVFAYMVYANQHRFQTLAQAKPKVQIQKSYRKTESMDTAEVVIFQLYSSKNPV